MSKYFLIACSAMLASRKLAREWEFGLDRSDTFIRPPNGFEKGSQVLSQRNAGCSDGQADSETCSGFGFLPTGHEHLAGPNSAGREC